MGGGAGGIEKYGYKNLGLAFLTVGKVYECIVSVFEVLEFSMRKNIGNNPVGIYLFKVNNRNI